MAGKCTIGIVGSGALGSYFGIRLAASGNRVQFLMRSDLQAVQAGGMKLQLSGGEIIKLDSVEAKGSTTEMVPCDVVLIALKTTSNHLLRELIAPVVGQNTVLVTVQNGLGNVELLEELFPGTPVVGALCQIGVNRVEPGIIQSFVPGDGFVQIGEGKSANGEVIERMFELFSSSGIKTKETASIGEALWRKLMWNVPFNGLTVAVGGVGTDHICTHPRLRKIAICLMEEIRRAANALGHSIEDEYPEKLMGFTDKLGDYKASSVLDWQNGRPLEVEAIWQNPLEAGQANGISMPYLESLTGVLEGLAITASDKKS